MKTRLGNIVGFAALAISGFLWLPAPAHAEGGQSLAATASATAVPTLDSEEWAFLTLINNYRAQNGAGPLQVSIALENSSQWMSTDMAAKNYVSHTDSLGRDPSTRGAAFGYPYGVDENIAAGFSTAQSVFNAFESACDANGSGQCTYAHRGNMLNPGVQVIGIARAYGTFSSYGWFWTTDFGGVLDAVITPPAPGAPIINSFMASPISITAGQASTLSWNVSGATSITMDNGFGSVPAQTQTSVSPTQTTTYNLTATNSAGTTTAAVTVTVSGTPPPPDTQPPSMPTLVLAMVKSSTEVDLTWTASTDNVGVAGYQVIRNGALLTNVTGGGLTYADTSAVGGVTYTYSIVAYDAAGNKSPASNTIQVTTPGNCPAPATGAFTGCYYTNATLTGTPALIRTDSQINFDWYNSPGPPLTSANFSVQWQGNFTFATAGLYNFSAIVSDGMRVYIDGTLVLDGWRNQAPRRYSFSASVTQGTHLIAIAYYDQTGTPTAHLSWQSTGAAPTPGPAISTFVGTPSAITSGQPAMLSWSVSGATTITLNNGIGDVSSLTSKSVSPTQTTTYTLTASNSAGTVTAQTTVTVSAAAQPPASPTGTCPSPATGAFTGCYYNTLDLTGNPVFARTDSQINFDWSTTPPDKSVSSQFSVRWQGNFTFAAGTYTFTLTTSDGMRIYIDGNLVVNRWYNINPPQIMAYHPTFTQGTHLITVEYYESTGDATAHLSWLKN